MKIKATINHKFQFKKFSVSHHRSSIKIGVDGVITGCWGIRNYHPEDSLEILDVGTGCGLIALICAQRFPNANVHAIDIDYESIKEADENFDNSPWSSRLIASHISFGDLLKSKFSESKYDVIISNPPFFNSGIKLPATARELARHGSEFSPLALVEGSRYLLKEGGELCFITIAEQEKEIEVLAARNYLLLKEKCLIKSSPGKKPHRVLFSFIKESESTFDSQPIESETLTIRESDNEYSESYLNLTKDFYLFIK